jgi:hypothetical protein
MMTERALVEAIFDAALEGTGGGIDAHARAVWMACQTLMADVLRGADQFTRERLLRELPQELRTSIDHLSQLLHPRLSPYPCHPLNPEGPDGTRH